MFLLAIVFTDSDYESPINQNTNSLKVWSEFFNLSDIFHTKDKCIGARILFH
jgi:hypothetical protein